MHIYDLLHKSACVTPLAGVWIEIYTSFHVSLQKSVTPLAGVWIEITVLYHVISPIWSLPLRECGLK